MKDMAKSGAGDPMGRAILERVEGVRTADRLKVFSPMFEEDEIPLDVLFRSYEEMPQIERKALDAARGRTLDVGAGAGCHSLVLQERGIDVTAIDLSPLSVEAMRRRGVKRVLERDFFQWHPAGEVFDTILMLMNGIGMVGAMQRMPAFFSHLHELLAEGGQLLCDSSDIRYVFEDDDGIVVYPATGDYYGELTYQMQYKDTLGDCFPWLYIDGETLKGVAQENGFMAEIVAEGDHYDYLARITRNEVR